MKDRDDVDVVCQECAPKPGKYKDVTATSLVGRSIKFTVKTRFRGSPIVEHVWCYVEGVTFGGQAVVASLESKVVGYNSALSLGAKLIVLLGEIEDAEDWPEHEPRPSGRVKVAKVLAS